MDKKFKVNELAVRSKLGTLQLIYITHKKKVLWYQRATHQSCFLVFLELNYKHDAL